jgi:precorrin-6B methylase 2
MLKSIAKQVLQTVAPRKAAEIFAARARAHSQRMFAEWGLLDLDTKLIAHLGNRVLSGPFQGLTLSPMTYKEHVGPYLLGTYEIELHPWWRDILSRSFDQIIDVGSKFGYYAVGLGRQFPQAEVVAFDTDPWARAATREMIEANGTPHVSVQGFCSPQWLRDNLRENSFIVSDCEGYEHELFCSLHIPALGSAVMLIEMHEHVSPGVSSAVQSRFARTHTISRVVSRSETPLPAVDFGPLSADEARRASSEVRLHQEWIMLAPTVTQS